MANNSCFAMLHRLGQYPNLGSHVLRQTIQRLSADWERFYGHELLFTKIFIDPRCIKGRCKRSRTGQAGTKKVLAFLASPEPKRMYGLSTVLKQGAGLRLQAFVWGMTAWRKFRFRLVTDAALVRPEPVCIRYCAGANQHYLPWS